MNGDNSEKLDQLKTRIENMPKYHQIEILKILSKKLSKINENKSGCYINMTFLPEDTLKEIEEYVGYIKDQEESLETMEYQKEEFKNAFFVEKENKDNPTVLYSSLNK
jgi:hypothetical protein